MENNQNINITKSYYVPINSTVDIDMILFNTFFETLRNRGHSGELLDLDKHRSTYEGKYKTGIYFMVAEINKSKSLSEDELNSILSLCNDFKCINSMVDLLEFFNSKNYKIQFSSDIVMTYLSIISTKKLLKHLNYNPILEKVVTVHRNLLDNYPDRSKHINELCGQLIHLAGEQHKQNLLREGGLLTLEGINSTEKEGFLGYIGRQFRKLMSNN